MSKSDTRKADEALAAYFPPQRLMRCLVEQVNAVTPAGKRTVEFVELLALMSQVDAVYPGAPTGRRRRKRK
jgi:hypothetical protein